MKPLSAQKYQELVSVLRDAEAKIKGITGQEVTLLATSVDEATLPRDHANMILSMVHEMCKILNMDYDDFTGKTRKREWSDARIMVTKAISMVYPKINNTELGRIIDQVDHATILHRKKTFDNMYETNKAFRQAFDELRNCLSIRYPGMFYSTDTKRG